MQVWSKQPSSMCPIIHPPNLGDFWKHLLTLTSLAQAQLNQVGTYWPYSGMGTFHDPFSAWWTLWAQKPKPLELRTSYQFHNLSCFPNEMCQNWTKANTWHGSRTQLPNNPQFHTSMNATTVTNRPLKLTTSRASLYNPVCHWLIDSVKRNGYIS